MLSLWGCVGCGGMSPSREQLFCAKCQRELRTNLNEKSDCEHRSLGMNIHSLGVYEGLWSRWIKDIKRRSRGFVLLEERKFLDLLVEYYFDPEDFNHVDALVPIPANPARNLFETDLSALFAASLSKRLKKPLFRELKISWRWLLKRHSAQKDRASPEDRWKLLSEQKFLWTGKNDPGLRVGVVDDITTTGATLTAARRCLEEAEIGCTGALVLAQAPPKKLQTGSK